MAEEAPNIRRDLAAGHDRRAGSAELALRRHGLTSHELLRLAQAASEAGLSRMKPPPPLDHGEREDLVSALLEYGLRWAVVYDIDRDPKRNFATSVYSRMRLRVIDWCRTNIHDPRFGTNKRHTALDMAAWDNGAPPDSHVLHGMDDDLSLSLSLAPREYGNPAARPMVPWDDSVGDAFVEVDFQESSVSRMRVERWEAAADRAGVSLNEWLFAIADRAAADELEEAA